MTQSVKKSPGFFALNGTYLKHLEKETDKLDRIENKTLRSISAFMLEFKFSIFILLTPVGIDADRKFFLLYKKVKNHIQGPTKEEESEALTTKLKFAKERVAELTSDIGITLFKYKSAIEAQTSDVMVGLLKEEGRGLLAEKNKNRANAKKVVAKLEKKLPTSKSGGNPQTPYQRTVAWFEKNMAGQPEWI